MTKKNQIYEETEKQEKVSEETIPGETNLEETTPAETAPGETPTGEPAEEETKKRKKRVTFENVIYDILNALENSVKDPLILQYVGEYGFTETKLKQGITFAEEARDRYTDQKKARANFMGKLNDAVEKRDKAARTYMYFVKIIRLSFGSNNDILEKLGLRGKRRNDFGGWVAQTKLFYKNIVDIPEVLAELEKHSITTEVLKAGEQEVLDAEVADIDKTSAKADAQKATELKNKAFATSRKWWRKYYKIANIALEDDPQLKEKLGIVVPFESFN